METSDKTGGGFAAPWYTEITKPEAKRRINNTKAHFGPLQERKVNLTYTAFENDLYSDCFWISGNVMTDAFPIVIPPEWPPSRNSEYQLGPGLRHGQLTSVQSAYYDLKSPTSPELLPPSHLSNTPH